MATIEQNGLMVFKDASGNKFILYPVTHKDNVDGMEVVDEHLLNKTNPHEVTAEQVRRANGQTIEEAFTSAQASIMLLSQDFGGAMETLTAKDTDLQSQITTEQAARYDSIERIISPLNRMIAYSKGLLFGTNNSTEYFFIGLDTCTDNTVIIPEEYNGRPVTSIGIGALAQNGSAVETLVIPPSVQTVRQAAFMGGTSLKTVIFLSETPPKIENASEFTALEAVFVPKIAIAAYKAKLSDCADKIKTADFPYTIEAVISDIYAQIQELKAMIQ